MIEEKITPLDCILGTGDNTASMDWMWRSNFREIDEDNIERLAKQKNARTLAEFVLTTNTTLYRQWFRGADNIVANSLSRYEYFLPNKTHEIFLQHSATLQVPKGFRILPVPKDI